MASNVFNYGIRKVILQKAHNGLVIELVETDSGMWAILLFKNDDLDQSRCYCWFSERIKKSVQLQARRDFKKYKNLLIKNQLNWF